MQLIEKQSLSLKILIDIIPQVRGRLAEAEAKKKAEAERKEVPDHIKEKFKTWNKGVAQVRQMRCIDPCALYVLLWWTLFLGDKVVFFNRT